ncbi:MULTISPECIES: transcriptional regulator NosR [unclassified Colwellia]|uniref:transcriptional regulator NosR n=1 Tax=unclassified Colwellia TaxID=196834 RepID=UPI0015F3B8F5|nr:MULTISPECIES: NosR/NirI family protein [unclassified Colwellia]MBA6380757.1 regulatory protein NosR [Colwellia sp. BRX10-7]MBA6388288.1 regulatory protein NosR [Colwellia sp. BRX10-2]MBA6403304.1 regulatory protein NosR [Colwellia sp. BRX10-5]MBA6407143.1 regulatory protein NosR [Colwellia sp. BRX10-1]
MAKNRVKTSKINSLLLMLSIFLSVVMPAQALFVSPPKDPIPLIHEIFPEATSISDKQGEPLIWTIYKDKDIIGYAFETNDLAKMPAYSGEPVNMLVAISPAGVYLGAKVLEHHEPIILAGIPESKLYEFADQYNGLNVSDRLKVGGNNKEGVIHIDGLSGATVTVMVMNVAITKAATKVARSLGIIKASQDIIQPMSRIYPDVYQKLDWQGLLGDGSIRKLALNRKIVDEAFAGTRVEHVDEASAEQKQQLFAEIYFAQADIPTVGRNLLGDSEYQWLMASLKEGEHAIIMLGNGYSYKGSGYVRGGIFDRIQILQNNEAFAFRDLDHNRVTDLYIAGAPRFKEMSLFIVRAEHQFNPGVDWQVELLVRRQLGAVDSLFTSFKGDYHTLDKYVDRPALIYPEPELTLIQEVWQEKEAEVIILIILLAVVVMSLFFQDILVRHPTFMHNFRHLFLIITVVFIGWSWGGQLSVVNVFTFLQALMSDFSWDLFLLDPIIFILWGAAAVTMILWGRAVYCGWLCPFGALQELMNIFARYIKIPQFELPWAVHERLWAIKYLILLALFGLSMESLSLAEHFAEVEPFKTTFLLKFDREWPFVLYASVLLIINIFNRKFFCRYLCPLGAALSTSNSIRLFSWLRRRPECGQPCKTCAKECEIQAIDPNGVINMRECHYCLDCQVTYFNDEKCPPLKKLARKKAKYKETEIEAVNVG